MYYQSVSINIFPNIQHPKSQNWNNFQSGLPKTPKKSLKQLVSPFSSDVAATPADTKLA